MILALDHMHQNGIAHRDIKPANIMLDIDYKNIKISDFGSSNTFSGEDGLFYTITYSKGYGAPEIV